MVLKFSSRTFLRRLTAIVFCALFVLLSPFTLRAGLSTRAASSSYWKSQYDAIKNQRDVAKNATDSIADKLYGEQAKLNSLEEKRDLQQQEINSIRNEMSLLEKLIESYAMEIEEKEASMAELTETMRAGFEIFCQRLVFMHESGGEGYLDFLFNSGDFSDFLSRGEIMNDFLNYDTNLIKKLQQDYQTLQTTKEEVTLLSEEAAKSYEEYEEQSLVLQAKIEVYNQQIDDYEAVLASIREEYNAAKSRENALNEDLDYAEEQIEIAKKKEQEAQRSGGGGNQSAGSYGRSYTGSRFPCPLDAGTYIKTQPFGYGHGGVDLATWGGAAVPIYAAEAGTVVASYRHPSWGEMVKISHGDLDVGENVYTLYAHMQAGSRCVQVGEYVSAGQMIGRVGSTGNSTGAHLHFELYIGGADTNYRCNPEAY